MDVGLVCDACSALTPIGVPQCTRCGAAVALDPRPRRSSKPSGSDPGPRSCTKCGATVGAGQRFCAACGSRVVSPVSFEVETRVGPRPSAEHAAVGPRDAQPRKSARESKPGRNTLFFGGAMQAARAKLTLIRGDGD